MIYSGVMIYRGEWVFPKMLLSDIRAQKLQNEPSTIKHSRVRTLFYKKLIFEKLGLRWLNNKETSRAAITFLIKLSCKENLRN